ncbi:LuxR family transcriptional regulator [Shimia thalassica]|uniref:LuxR family transcriptional regulator n=1 Tax=Shimia thalassica TaxID=1715693 RepID=UPI0026E26DA5|nr:LuxR family transcriptional regulator [Shimia thalassica]MDO6485157.1 LuxR family transcriptional regulator [Shimia thalassica]MDP2518983.1 LuxR family transcriptional regulator [Shimia thalassica]MDP2581396.1 LuxR family transcriptional regulator [Shimia thalassica]
MTLEYIEAITNAQSLEELWAMHTEFMASYGFDRLIYGYTNFRTNGSLGDVEDFMILSNHDRAYLDKFLGEGLYFNGPMMRWSLENTGACSWSWVQSQAAQGNLTKDEISVFEVNAQMGVFAGYTISFPTISSRTKGAIAMTAQRELSQADVDFIWARDGKFIELANNIAHLKILSLPYDYPDRMLTKRQREVLEWVGDGKTIQDIATLIGRTPATIEKHLRLAREALNVETTAQALLKASFLHQIYRP